MVLNHSGGCSLMEHMLQFQLKLFLYQSSVFLVECLRGLQVLNFYLISSFDDSIALKEQHY